MLKAICRHAALSVILGTFCSVSVATAEDSGKSKPVLLKLEVDQKAKVAEDRRKEMEEKQKVAANLRAQKKSLGDPIDDPKDKHE